MHGTQQNIGQGFRGARFGCDTAFMGTIEPKMGGSRPPISFFARQGPLRQDLRRREWDQHLPEYLRRPEWNHHLSKNSPTNELMSKHYGATPTN